VAALNLVHKSSENPGVVSRVFALLGADGTLRFLMAFVQLMRLSVIKSGAMMLRRIVDPQPDLGGE
jgi:hypothetical protein